MSYERFLKKSHKIRKKEWLVTINGQPVTFPEGWRDNLHQLMKEFGIDSEIDPRFEP